MEEHNSNSEMLNFPLSESVITNSSISHPAWKNHMHQPIRERL